MSDPLLEYFRDPNHAIYNGTQHDPDSFSRDKTIAEKHGVPRETVSNNLIEFQRKDKLNSIDADALKKTNPKLADFFLQQDNVAQSHDDIESLSALERSIASYRAPDRGIINNSMRALSTRAFDLGGNLLQFIGNVSKMGGEGMAELTGINPGLKFGDDGISWTWDVPKDDLGEYVAEAGKSVSEFGKETFDYVPEFTWENFKGEMTPANLSGYIFEQGIQSLPDMAAAVLTLPAYVASRTEEIAESRVQNDKRAEVEAKDLATALPVAVTVSFLERIGAMSVFKVGDVTGLKTAAKEIGRATLREASTEFVQEQIEYAGETVGTKTGFNLATMLDRGVAGAVAGGGMGGAIRAGTATYEGVKFGREAKRNIESTQEQQTLDVITEKAQASKLNGRNRQLFQEFVKTLGDQDVYIDPDVLAEYYDGDNQEIIEQVESAANLGVDVIIPLEVYASEIATLSNAEEVRNHTRMSEDSLTKAQMEGVDPSGMMKELIESVRDNEDVLSDAEKIFEDVQAQLISTGRLAPKNAKQAASIIPAYVTTKVKALKSRGVEVTAEEIYRDMGLTIEQKEITDEGLLQEAPQEIQRKEKLRSIEVTTKDIIEETGEAVEITEIADDAINRIDSRLRGLESMLDCLK